MNHAADSLINQLIDGGTLATASGGLLSRNIRVRSGNFNVMPGVFKRTDASSDELRNGVFPWPVKEPSLVLFQLLGLLLDAGQKIGSVSNAMMGENPGQNQPATTTMAVLEQGLQVFSAIYKRIYRSMTEEFRRWYELDREYAQNSNDYQFDPKIVRPTADPSAVAQSQRMLKAEALMGRVTQAPHLYGMEGAVKAELRYLEALDIQNADDWLKDAQPPQDPKAAVEKQKLEFEAKKFEMNFQLEVAKEERERNRTRSTILKDRATVETKLRNAALNEEKQAWQELLDVMNHELQVLDEQRKDRVEQPRDNEAA
jgi:chaperonin GroES